MALSRLYCARCLEKLNLLSLDVVVARSLDTAFSDLDSPQSYDPRPPQWDSESLGSPFWSKSMEFPFASQPNDPGTAPPTPSSSLTPRSGTAQEPHNIDFLTATSPPLINSRPPSFSCEDPLRDTSFNFHPLSPTRSFDRLSLDEHGEFHDSADGHAKPTTPSPLKREASGGASTPHPGSDLESPKPPMQHPLVAPPRIDTAGFYSTSPYSPSAITSGISEFALGHASKSPWKPTLGKVAQLTLSPPIAPLGPVAESHPSTEPLDSLFVSGSPRSGTASKNPTEGSQSMRHLRSHSTASDFAPSTPTFDPDRATLTRSTGSAAALVASRAMSSATAGLAAAFDNADHVIDRTQSSSGRSNHRRSSTLSLGLDSDPHKKGRRWFGRKRKTVTNLPRFDTDALGGGESPLVTAFEESKPEEDDVFVRFSGTTCYRVAPMDPESEWDVHWATVWCKYQRNFLITGSSVVPIGEGTVRIWGRVLTEDERSLAASQLFQSATSASPGEAPGPSQVPPDLDQASHRRNVSDVSTRTEVSPLSASDDDALQDDTASTDSDEGPPKLEIGPSGAAHEGGLQQSLGLEEMPRRNTYSGRSSRAGSIGSDDAQGKAFGSQRRSVHIPRASTLFQRPTSAGAGAAKDSRAVKYPTTWTPSKAPSSAPDPTPKIKDKPAIPRSKSSKFPSEAGGGKKVVTLARRRKERVKKSQKRNGHSPASSERSIRGNSSSLVDHDGTSSQ